MDINSIIFEVVLDETRYLVANSIVRILIDVKQSVIIMIIVCLLSIGENPIHIGSWEKEFAMFLLRVYLNAQLEKKKKERDQTVIFT